MSTKNRKSLIAMQTLERVAPIIRHVAHPLRLRILDYLRQEGEPRNVTQITEATGSSQAIISQQLRILRDQGVLSAHREGHFILYSISNPNVLLLLDCIRRHEESCATNK
jgi:ArsR family transcriptional regulator